MSQFKNRTPEPAFLSIATLVDAGAQIHINAGCLVRILPAHGR